jgi:sulfate adenylyltransferase
MGPHRVTAALQKVADTPVAAPVIPCAGPEGHVHAHWPRGDLPSRLMSKWGALVVLDDRSDSVIGARSAAQSAPAVTLDDRALADLRLELSGVALPFNVLGDATTGMSLPPTGRARVRLGGIDRADASAHGELVIVDEESHPIAVLDDLIYDFAASADDGVVEGCVHSLGHKVEVPQPRIRRSRIVVVPARPLTTTDIRDIDVAAKDMHADVVVLVPTAGATPDGLPARLLRRCLAEVLPEQFAVVGVPLALRGHASADRELAAALARWSNGTHLWFAAAARHQLTEDTLEGIELLNGADDATWQRALDSLLLATDATVDEPSLGAAASVLSSWRPPRIRRGLVVFFTGLSGSGKSTLARGLVQHLHEHTTRTVTLLDGDGVRRMLSAELGFDHAGRDLNVRRIGFVAAEVARHGGIAVCAPIAPYLESRAAVRSMVEAVGDLVLVHVSTPLAECERRDVKGLYRRARAGLLPQFTGISDRYDDPPDAALRIDTSTLDEAACLALVVRHLEAGGWIPAASA